MTLLSVSDLSVSFGGRTVLDGVTLDVKPGEFIGLIGPNGAGKSTLLKAALQLIPATGAIAFGAQPAAHLSAPERAKRIAYLPQERDVAWDVPVEMVVALGRAPHSGGLGRIDARDAAAVDRAMRHMDIGHLAGRPATELSGGELARVLIARTLAQEAPLLLADEPAAGLDPAHQIALMRTLSGLASGERAVVASLHDLGLAARWCSRVVLLLDGRVLADGSPRDVLTDFHVRRAYGVTLFSREIDGRWIVEPLDTIDPSMMGADHD